LLRHQRITQHAGQEQNFDEDLLERVGQVIAACEAETGPLPQMPKLKSTRKSSWSSHLSSPELSGNDGSGRQSPISPVEADPVSAISSRNMRLNPPSTADGGIHSALIQAATIAAEREEEEERQRAEAKSMQDHKAKMQAVQAWLSQQQPVNHQHTLGQLPTLAPAASIFTPQATGNNGHASNSILKPMPMSLTPVGIPMSYTPATGLPMSYTPISTTMPLPMSYTPISSTMSLPMTYITPTTSMPLTSSTALVMMPPSQTA
jgi:hypothetical protein